MRRRLFAVASAISLLLCAVTVVGWMMAEAFQHSVEWLGRGKPPIEAARPYLGAVVCLAAIAPACWAAAGLRAYRRRRSPRGRPPAEKKSGNPNGK
jgi:hypothetical protein